MITPAWTLAFGFSLALMVQLATVQGTWYLDADDWFIVDMGRQVAADPTLSQFTRLWTEEPTWRPVLTVRTTLEYVLFGDAILPRIMVNLLLHLMSGLLVFMLARAWLGRPLAAAWAAVLFVAHPMHAESLAWFHSGFEGITVTVPVLIALWAFAARQPLVVGLVAFQVALLTRENALAVPFVITAAAMIRAAPIERWRQTFIDSSPYWLMVVANVAGRWIAVSLDPERAMGTFHMAEQPALAVLTTVAHPWIPIHPALEARAIWWAVFATVPFGLAFAQRGVPKRAMLTSFGLFALLTLPFLPQFHEAHRFLEAAPGGIEQRWYFFHLPLAGLVIWPAYLMIVRDRRRTGWGAAALAALAALFLVGQSFNARWWSNHGAVARSVAATVEAALTKRPRGLGIVMQGGVDTAEAADQVFLNGPLIWPEAAQRGVHFMHLRFEEGERELASSVVVQRQPRWIPFSVMPPTTRWWTWNPALNRMEPTLLRDIAFPPLAEVPQCCREAGHEGHEHNPWEECVVPTRSQIAPPAPPP